MNSNEAFHVGHDRPYGVADKEESKMEANQRTDGSVKGRIEKRKVVLPFVS